MKHKIVFLSLLIIVGVGIILIVFKRQIPPSGIRLQKVEAVNDVNYLFKEQISISPSNQWLLYITQTNNILSDGMPENKIVAYNLETKQKYILERKEVSSNQLSYGLERNCWTEDSKYCYIKNDTNTAIDFTSSEPKIIIKENTGKTLICSDCSVMPTQTTFSKRQHGLISYSPDKQHELRTISYGTGFVSQPYLYIVKNRIKQYIAIETYSINWTSDSRHAYILKRDNSVYRIDFES